MTEESQESSINTEWNNVCNWIEFMYIGKRIQIFLEKYNKFSSE